MHVHACSCPNLSGSGLASAFAMSFGRKASFSGVGELLEALRLSTASVWFVVRMAARRRTAEQEPRQKAFTSGRQNVLECLQEHLDDPM
jgi:hypothetical protein